MTDRDIGEIDQQAVERKLLRSLISKSPSEAFQPDNYTSTDFNRLEFQGTAGEILQRVRSYYELFSKAPTFEGLKQRFERKSETSFLLYLEEVAAEDPSWAGEYEATVRDWVEAVGMRRLDQVCRNVRNIAREGVTSKVGKEQVVQQGLEEAVKVGLESFVDLQHLASPNTKPWDNDRGSMHLHNDFIVKSENNNLSVGLTTGIDQIDEVTGGIRAGELWLVAGYAKHGKSTTCLNWVERWVTYGHNVLVVSVEMSTIQVWRVLATIHSCHPKFGRDQGLRYDDIKKGTLSLEDRQFYLNQVLPSLRSLPGTVMVIPPTERMTITEVRAKAEILNRREPLDAILIDYLGLMNAPTGVKAATKKDRIDANIFAAKQMALEFDNGQGIPVLSPHQINRTGVVSARANGGRYEVESLADSGEAERTSDATFSIYQDRAERDERRAMFTHLTSRDSALITEAPFEVDTIPDSRVIRSGTKRIVKMEDVMDS